MTPGEDHQTSKLLERWNGGDGGALNLLLEKHLPWIEEYVRRRLGPKLRRKGQTCDFVQDALVEFLRYGPRVTVNRNIQFRALMARIVENALRDRYDWFTAKRRDVARERPLPTDSVLKLDPPRRKGETPSRIVDRHEREAWIRLGIELLSGGDREVIVLREWEQLPFAEIGERLGISDEAARKRFGRALGRLSDLVDDLRRGEVDLEALAEPDPG